MALCRVILGISRYALLGYYACVILVRIERLNNDLKLIAELLGHAVISVAHKVRHECARAVAAVR